MLIKRQKYMFKFYSQAEQYHDLDRKVNAELIQYTEDFIFFLADRLASYRNCFLDNALIEEVKAVFPYLINKTHYIQIYSLCDVGYDYHKTYCNLNNAILATGNNLQDLFFKAVKVPMIYSDNTARLFFKGNNLIIQYTSKGLNDVAERWTSRL